MRTLLIQASTCQIVPFIKIIVKLFKLAMGRKKGPKVNKMAN